MNVIRNSGSIADKITIENLLARISQLETDVSGMAEKVGYKLMKAGETEAGSEIYEYEKTGESAPDGDYLNPILFRNGMKVTKGLFYTDSEDIWEAVKDGTPKNFMDTEFFEVITV